MFSRSTVHPLFFFFFGRSKHTSSEGAVSSGYRRCWWGPHPSCSVYWAGRDLPEGGRGRWMERDSQVHPSFLPVPCPGAVLLLHQGFNQIWVRLLGINVGLFFVGGWSLRKTLRMAASGGVNRTSPLCLCTVFLSSAAASWMALWCWTWGPTRWRRLQVKPDIQLLTLESFKVEFPMAVCLEPLYYKLQSNKMYPYRFFFLPILCRKLLILFERFCCCFLTLQTWFWTSMSCRVLSVQMLGTGSGKPCWNSITTKTTKNWPTASPSYALLLILGRSSLSLTPWTKTVSQKHTHRYTHSSTVSLLSDP